MNVNLADLIPALTALVVAITTLVKLFKHEQTPAGEAHPPAQPETKAPA